MELTRILLDFASSLVWPAVVVLALFKFTGPLSALIGRLQAATLPGGVDLDFRKELKEAQWIAEDIRANPEKLPDAYQKVELTDVNHRLLELGLMPSPSGLNFKIYRDLISEDPVLALAGLRTEVDAMIRNLASGFGVDLTGTPSTTAMLEKLYREGAIYQRQYNLGQKVVQLCNAAIHGEPIGRADAEAVMQIAEVLASEYVDWLGWGFQK